MAGWPIDRNKEHGVHSVKLLVARRPRTVAFCTPPPLANFYLIKFWSQALVDNQAMAEGAGGGRCPPARIITNDPNQHRLTHRPCNIQISPETAGCMGVSGTARRATSSSSASRAVRSVAGRRRLARSNRHRLHQHKPRVRPTPPRRRRRT